MSDLNARFNSTNLTLQDFKNIAENNNANAEVRIKKSDGKLSTSPLGFIARNIGQTHKNSNNQVTLAFWSVLIHDDKYRDIKSNLKRVMSSMNKSGEIKSGGSLTPAKINAAIKMADDMLEKFQKPKQSAETALQNALQLKVISQDQAESFKNFAEQKALEEMTKNTFAVVDKDGNESKSTISKPDQFLKKVLVDFYSSKNPDYFANSSLYTFTAEFVGGDKEKANAINTYLNELIPNLKGEVAREKVIANIKNQDYSGDLSKNVLKQKIINDFRDDSGLFDDKGLEAIAKLDKTKLDKIAQTIKPLFKPDEIKDNLKIILNVVQYGYKAYPGIQGDSDANKKNMDALIDKICSNVTERKGASSGHILNAVKNFHLDLFREELESNSEITQYCAEKGISVKALSALLTQPEYRNEILPKMSGDGSLKSYLTSYTLELANSNLELLGKLKNIETKDSLVNQTYVVASYANDMIEELGKDKPDGIKLLDCIKSIDNQMKSTGELSAEDSALVLKNAVQTLINSLDSEKKNKVLSENNQKQLLTLCADLNDIAKKDFSLSEDEKKQLDSLTKTLSDMVKVMTENLPADKVVNPSSVKISKEFSYMKFEQIKGRSVQRDASDAEIYTAQQLVKQNNTLPNEEKKLISELIKNTRCADLNFIMKFISGTHYDLLFSEFRKNNFHNQAKLIYELFNFGEKIEQLKTSADEFRTDDVIKFLFDAILERCTPQELLDLNSCLREPSTKKLLEVLNTQNNKEKLVKDEDCDASNKKASNFECIDTAFEFINKFGEALASKLNLPEQGPLFDPNAKISADELNYKSNLIPALSAFFPRSYTPFDEVLLGYTELSQEKKAEVKEFVSKFKIPVNDKAPFKNIGAYGAEKKFPYTFTNEEGENEESDWSVRDFMALMGSHVKELSELLDKTGGNPTAQQIWEIVHGGKAPSDLTMDNFVEKISLTLHSEIRALGAMMGKEFIPEFFLGYAVETGIPFNKLIQKLSKADKEDIVFDLKEQAGQRGPFSKHEVSGFQFEKGKDNFGFSCDFGRTILAQGVKDKNYCQIKLIDNNGQETLFKESDYAEQPDIYAKKNYLENIPKKIREGLGNISDKQLAGIGNCVTQNMQSLLRNAKTLYYKVSEGFEHTALDHTIKKLDNGNIQVTINEQPGTAFFKFHLVMEVRPDGVSFCTEGKITYASIEKIQKYKEQHPEVSI